MLELESWHSENNHFTEMCSGSEAGSHLGLIDFEYHSTLGLRVIKKKKNRGMRAARRSLGEASERRGNTFNGVVCKAHRLLYHSTLGLRVVKKQKKL